MSDSDSGLTPVSNDRKRTKKKLPSSKESASKKLKTNTPEGTTSNDTPTSRPKRNVVRKSSKTLSVSSGLATTQKPASLNEEVFSIPGVIKSLQLRNFMCHSVLDVEFHKNLNFITGQNGSGKSAVLSGILVALGGKANVTSRTSSLKSLVQKGKNACRVTITLYNKRGLRRYGDEITIERTITSSGAGSYKMKFAQNNDQEGWRPLKKPELDSILIGLNIQLDNPVAILNQEVARSFLRSKDPKVKFKLFHEGTMLSKMETVLEDTRVQLSETGNILKGYKDNIAQMSVAINKLQAKHDKIGELNKVKMQVKSIHIEFLWSLVNEQEESLKKSTNQIAKADKELELLRSKLDQARQSFSSLNEARILRQEKEVNQKLQVKKPQLTEVKLKMNEMKRNFQTVRQKLDFTLKTIATKDLQIKKLSSNLEKLKNEQAAQAQEKSNEDQEKLDSLETRRTNLESVANSISMDKDNFQLAADKEKEKLDNIDNRKRQLNASIEAKKRNIESFNRNKANKYSAYGPKMQQLIAKIQANVHKFRKPPRGPLGACFTVKDPQYLPLIEKVLGPVLQTFVVDNAKDLLLLKELSESVFNDRAASQSQRFSSGRFEKTPMIVKMEFSNKLYDISRYSASHPSAPTLLELIAAENNDHIVINALIDIAEIERVLLFKTNNDACQLLKHQHLCPKSLRMAYTLEYYKFTPAPRYAARVMNNREQSQILKSGRGRENELAHLKSEINILERNIADLAPERVSIQSEEQTLREKFNEKQGELSGIRRQIGQLRLEIDRHKENMKHKRKQGDLSCYYEELEELTEEKSKRIEERDELNKQFEELQPSLLSSDETRKEIEKEIQDLNQQLSEFEEARDNLNSRKAEMENVLRQIKGKIASLESSKSGITEEIEKKKEEIQRKIESAEKAGSRVDSNRKSTELKQEFNALTVRIKETEAHLGDVDELKRRLTQRKKRRAEAEKEFNPLNQMHILLTSVNVEHIKSLDNVKAYMGRTLQLFFEEMAKQRGYEGRLVLDCSAHELYYFVCPDGDSSVKTLKALDAQTDSQGHFSSEHVQSNRKVKKALVEYSLGLSGGERSFATICFIMALWQVMECPFYMLDEFDVFMDAFNRKTSQTALMAHAKKFQNRQFILFTPLDLSEIPSKEDATVLRLFPPVRGTSGNEDPSASSAETSSASVTKKKGGSRTRGKRRLIDEESEC